MEERREGMGEGKEVEEDCGEGRRAGELYLK